MSDRLSVRKTYKLWIGGAFVRSESGRYDEVHGFNFPRGSRKDVRDAVAAARKAAGPWAARTAYNRGQILYRAAEALESRGDAIGAQQRGVRRRRRRAPALRRLDRQDRAGARRREPGRRAVPVVLAPRADRSGRDRRPRRAAAARPGRRAGARRSPAGTSCVAILSAENPLPGLDLAEVLGVSDVPGGVVNLLAGRRGELATALGAHRDLNAIVDAAGDAELSAELDRLAAETIKRVRHGSAAASYAEAVDDSLERIEAVVELKTAWHPVGA